MRLRVCNKIGPSFEPFLFNLCWNMIDPSGMLVVPAVVAMEVNVDVANVLDVVAFFNVCVVCSTALLLIPFPFNVAASALVMVVGFFKGDWITNLFDSVDNFGVVDAFLCRRIDCEFDVRLSSSLLAILTAPLFNKLNKSCPFCKMI